MTFANPVPWWAFLLIIGAAGLLAVRAYSRTVLPLSRTRRTVLSLLRFVTLLALVVFLLRPVVIEPRTGPRNEVVPVLVDTSRSMRLADVETERRIDRAARVLNDQLLPALSNEFRIDLLSFADGVAPADATRLDANGRHTNLSGALQAIRERYRGQRVAGIVLLSDGGDTSGRDASGPGVEGSWPVYPIGFGSPRLHRDRELVSVTAGEAALEDSVVELSASIVSHGFGTMPIEVRVLENGQPIQVRRVRPADDGSPVREVFQVSPKRDAATLYSVEIARDATELVLENNSRSVLVRPPGRARRVLLLQGGPGYEHSFLLRAWSQDPGLEVDSVVRKGQNERGVDTFYVRADASRTAALAEGYPTTKEALFGYDAIVLANVEGDFFTREQLDLTAEFVAARGGGLLVLGARSFAQASFAGTAIEEVLPVELTDRGGGLARTAVSGANGTPNQLILTVDGESHPIMRLGPSVEESRQKWAAMPPLASSAPVGGARAGASILAVTPTPGGPRPLVAVQPYGEGRSMLFSGEAAWRWKMMVASTDRTYDTFWRQAARWLASPAPDPIAVRAPSGAGPEEPLSLDVYARDAGFAPLRDASVTVRVSGPGLPGRDLETVLADSATGRFSAGFRAEQPGVYRVTTEVRRKEATLGSAENWMLVGGGDDELADPRRNDEVLSRLAGATGGQFMSEDDIRELVSLLQARSPEQSPPRYRDLWHNGWALGVIIVLLGTEWVVRRRAGMR